MAVFSSNPSSVVANTGTWTNPGNVYASDNVYATHTGTTQNTEYAFEVGGFNLSAIPAGSTILSTTVVIEAKVSTASRAQIKGELLDGSTVLGTLALTTLSATETNYYINATATLAQLQSANLKVRVTNKRIVSQTATTSVDWVKIDVVTPEPLATLTDDFPGTTLNASKWNEVWDASTNTLVNNTAQLPLTSAYSALGVSTAKGYSAAGTSVYAKVTPPASAASRLVIMKVQFPDTNNRVAIFWAGSATTPKLWNKVVVGGTSVLDQSIDYDPVAHAWWKLTFSGTTISWHTSPDGTTWTQRWTYTQSFPMAPVVYRFECGTSAGDSGLSTAYVDNVNTVPPLTTGRPKVWTGSAYAQKPGKYWNGTSWVEKPWKVWDGSTWKTAK